MTRLTMAYVAGVVSGDGWLTDLSLGLRVADHDFAAAFGKAVGRAPRQDERDYWLVRLSNQSGRFDNILTFEPRTPNEKARWLRGLFDSEGNAMLRKNGVSENSYSRRVAMYSTNQVTLHRAAMYLLVLGILTRLTPCRSSSGHLGPKLVWELAVCGDREYYRRFARLIGSSIRRKRIVLNAMPRSYRPDSAAHHRAAQLKGARAKHDKTMTQTLPRVVAGVRQLITVGIKPTQRACRAIPGFNTIQRHVSQARLVEMATCAP